jgi:hypothetical protein
MERSQDAKRSTTCLHCRRKLDGNRPLRSVQHRGLKADGASRNMLPTFHKGDLELMIPYIWLSITMIRKARLQRRLTEQKQVLALPITFEIVSIQEYNMPIIDSKIAGLTGDPVAYLKWNASILASGRRLARHTIPD